MPYFKSGDIDIYYETTDSKDKPRLLYISGTGSDLRKKPNIFDSPLQQVFQIASYDQRGLGRSSKPDRPYSMADYADDALKMLDHLGWERAHVLGVSFGGMVAQELAISHCDRIERLVLCCTSSGGEGGASYPLHELDALTEVERARKIIAVADRRCSAQWIRDNPAFYDAMIKETLAAAQFAAHERDHAIGARRQLEARRYHDTYERLRAITCPTLVCGGKYDDLATPDNLKALAEKLPGASLAFFEGGHLFLLQDDKAFARIGRYLLDD